ncbi:hypothetical protein GW17_00048577 [Ensete ventricosum]|nr:hypothetical protein GW17_00048577 [Ensete ventricosum]
MFRFRWKKSSGSVRSAHRVESWLSGLGSAPSLNPTRFNSFLIELGEGFGHSSGSRHLPCLFSSLPGRPPTPRSQIPLQAAPYHDTAAGDQQLSTTAPPPTAGPHATAGKFRHVGVHLPFFSSSRSGLEQ